MLEAYTVSLALLEVFMTLRQESLSLKTFLASSRHRTCGRGCDASFGQLVGLGFGIAAFTPAPYQRHSL